MATDTTRPNATPLNDGGAIFGGSATIHEALSDDTDATGVELDENEDCRLGFVEPTIPPGAVVKRLVLRARHRRVGASAISLQYILYPRYGTAPTVNEDAVFALPSSHATVTAVVLDNPGAISDLQAAVLEYGHTAVNDARVYELWADTIYVAQPAVTVTAPTGTLTEDTTPTAAWTATLDGDGGAQTHIEYKLFTDAQYGAGGFDPDTSTAYRESGELAFTGSSATFADPIADGTYRIYLRVAQTVNGELHWSDWDFEGFVIDVDKPANPTVVVTPESGAARMLIEVTDPGGGAVDTDSFEIQASYNGGATWSLIRTPNGDGQITPGDDAWDWEAPNGVPATYRARAIHDWGDTYSYSAWVSDTDTWTSRSWWFKHPTIPGLNYEAAYNEMHSFAGKSQAARQSIQQPLGAEFPIVVSDTRSSPVGQITVRCDTDDARDALDALLNRIVPILVQGPADEYEDDRWVVIGDTDRTRVIDKSWISSTLEVLNFTTVDRPSDERLTSLGLYPATDLFPAEELAPA